MSLSRRSRISPELRRADRNSVSEGGVPSHARFTGRPHPGLGCWNLRLGSAMFMASRFDSGWDTSSLGAGRSATSAATIAGTRCSTQEE